MKAYISDTIRSLSQPHPLKIHGKGIGFFIDPVKNSSEWSQSADGEEWQLTFFRSTPFECTLQVRFMDMEQTGPNYFASKAIWLNNKDKPENNAELITLASGFLRGSQTVTAEQITATTSTRGLIVDSSGLAYFSESPEQFERIVLTQAMALAYRQVMHQCMNRLTAAVKANDIENTLTLYEQILSFNASDYFRHPVHFERHEMSAVWDILVEQCRLHTLNTELTEQLSGVAMLLREKRERQNLESEKKREKRFNHGVAFAGIMLSLLSVLSLVELTPQHFKNAYTNWLTPIMLSQSVEASEEKDTP